MQKDAFCEKAIICTIGKRCKKKKKLFVPQTIYVKWQKNSTDLNASLNVRSRTWLKMI
jgi:hypothetical protein